MGCVSGKHPEEGTRKRPQVQKEENAEPVYRPWSSIPALRNMQGLSDRKGLCQVYQLPRQAQVRGA